MKQRVVIEGRFLPRGVKHLGTAVICGVRVPVVAATAAQVPELAGESGTYVDGMFFAETNVIYVRAGQSETQLRDSVNHEIGHAFVKLSGIGNLLAAVTTWPKGWDDLEETLVRIAAPHLGEALRGTYARSRMRH